MRTPPSWPAQREDGHRSARAAGLAFIVITAAFLAGLITAALVVAR